MSAKQGINLLQSRMHNNNWVHGYLTEHNVTLDAKIIDLDSVENIGEGSIRGKSIINDIISFKNALVHYFAKYFKKLDNSDFTFDDFIKLFNEEYSNEIKKLNKAPKT